MSTDLLRVYREDECGPDGYPRVWALPSVVTRSGTVLFGKDVNLVASGIIEDRPAIKHLIREQAGRRCLRCGHPYPPGIAETHPRGEWTPCDEHCTHGGPLRGVLYNGGDWRIVDAVTPSAIVQARWRILTVHHLNEDKADCRWWNLAALCQRCHLRMQRAVVMGRPYHYEHSAWFKPFAAGFYAWKYEQAELTREETLARLDELLAYEQRFTQETLL